MEEIPVITSSEFEEKTRLPEHPGAKFMPGFKRIIVVGSSNTGKTYSLTRILPALAIPANLFLCVNGTIHQPVYDSIISYMQGQVVPNTGSTVNVITLPTLMSIKKRILDNTDLEKDYHNIIIIDDFLERADLSNPNLEALFATSRHKHCSVILITQDFTNIPLSIKKNATDLALFPSRRIALIYKYVEDYFTSQRDFERLYRDATAPFENRKYNFMLINLEPNCPEDKRIRRNLTGYLTDYL